LLNTTLMPYSNSTTKRKDFQTTSRDLLPKKTDLKTKLIPSANVLVPNLPLPKPPVTSSPETPNSGTKPKPSVPHSITNITMPPKPEDKNSN
jgi:hypothetical protein